MRGSMLVECLLTVALIGFFTAGVCLIAIDKLDRYRLDQATSELVADMRLVQMKSMNGGDGAFTQIAFSYIKPYGYYLRAGGKIIRFRTLDPVQVVETESEPLTFGSNGFPSKGRRIILHCGKYTRHLIIDFVGRIRVTEGAG
ncbi:hypothetical protein [Azotosporobacter soli]|uniref:pilus assembly FimT family protein n=1 Tax=Azotosporobacter soli TaxID=3055040 RepID=UPI0031FEC864